MFTFYDIVILKHLRKTLKFISEKSRKSKHFSYILIGFLIELKVAYGNVNLVK